MHVFIFINKVYLMKYNISMRIFNYLFIIIRHLGRREVPLLLYALSPYVIRYNFQSYRVHEFPLQIMP